jgi:hypothetical protein
VRQLEARAEVMDSEFTIERVQQADYRLEAHFDNPEVLLNFCRPGTALE